MFERDVKPHLTLMTRDVVTVEIKTVRYTFWQWEQLHIFVAISH